MQKAAGEPIILVSGLPRSGTSMMMQMLDRGGLPVLTDQFRAADTDNPEGYYEYEPVKKLRERSDWLEQARGKAVKIIYSFLRDLPATYPYRILFMDRHLPEVLQSQQKMLARRGTTAASTIDDAQLAQLFAQQLQALHAWLAEQPNMQTMTVSYNQLLQDSEPQVDRILSFLERPLDRVAMLAVVQPDLYRNRVLNP